MDIATYDFSEKMAIAGLDSWVTAATFSPVTFENTGFPTRLTQIGDIRRLLAGMHGRGRVTGFLAELGGLREGDLDRLTRAMARYMRWYQTLLPDAEVPVPVADFVAQYVAVTKLRGLAPRGRVLEVGAGYGLTAFLVRDDPEIRDYDLIEITQSLYILQALVCAHCYGPAFRNLALTPPQPVRVGALATDSPSFDARRSFRIAAPRTVRCRLYPWWELDVALERPYDAIVSNANLAEMSAQALEYYLRRWHTILADDGHLLVQDLGNAAAGHGYEAVLKAIDSAGFRALAKAQGRQGDKLLQFWNLLLVTERHPDFGRARPVLEAQVFLDDHPTVRRAYGLDLPKGESIAMRDLVAGISRHLAEMSEG